MSAREARLIDLVAFITKWRGIIGGASPTAEGWAVQFEEEAKRLLEEDA